MEYTSNHHRPRQSWDPAPGALEPIQGIAVADALSPGEMKKGLFDHRIQEGVRLQRAARVMNCWGWTRVQVQEIGRFSYDVKLDWLVS